MRSLNASVSPLLLNAIGELAEKEGISFQKLARAVAELSLLFTKKRAAIRRSYLEEPVLASAYLQYFLPVNLSKIQALLNEMPALEVEERFSVLDLGSGPGTGALAVLDWWHQRGATGALSIVAVDSSSMAQRQAKQLWDHYCRIASIAEANLRTYESDIERHAWLEQAGKGALFDLIIVANSLNEMYVDAKDPITARASFMTEVLSLLAPHGTLMIVEPALRETSRALHQVRDRLLEEKHCTVYSPCLHEERCPALVNPDDWCHEERAWVPPVWIQEIDREVGFIKDALKFSYLLLRTDGRTIAKRSSDTFRVVSELRKLKGDTRAWLCNEQGRSEVARLDRACSAANAAWDHCQRGTIVRIEGMTRKDGAALVRIPAEATVKIVRPV
ncbi:MAG TPA: small ribosomal subunit Rsm22 family protein [Nitrospira sp.]|nr:small ribosomal subunit Rsm22 family protein [Nitrospira sp.]